MTAAQHFVQIVLQVSSYLRGVGKVDEQLHGSLINVTNDNLSLSALCQFSGKHGPKARHVHINKHTVLVDIITGSFLLPEVRATG